MSAHDHEKPYCQEPSGGRLEECLSSHGTEDIKDILDISKDEG